MTGSTDYHRAAVIDLADNRHHTTDECQRRSVMWKISPHTLRSLPAEVAQKQSCEVRHYVRTPQ